MICINREDYDNYRYAVAKEAFLSYFKQFKLESNEMRSNKMIVKDRDNRSVELVFARSDDDKKSSENRIKAYLISLHSTKESKPFIEDYPVDYKEYIRLYRRSFDLAITDSDRYMKSVQHYQELFEELIVKGFDEDEMCYKYYSSQLIEGDDNDPKSDDHGIKDGKISFSSPNTFNDPFDTNCFFANGTDISDLFRIFCVAPSPKLILLWSYYASEHKGYCFEYSKNEIYKAISSIGIPGILLVGDVKYTNNRPAQKSKLNTVSYSEVQFYIKAAFSKFEEWGHEREFRFVYIYKESVLEENKTDYLLRNELEETPGYLQVPVSIKGIYQGCKGKKNKVLVDSHGNILPYIQLTKDSKDYHLH